MRLRVEKTKVVNIHFAFWNKGQMRPRSLLARSNVWDYLLACITRCKCSMEITRNSVKVKFGIKIIKFQLVESLIGWDVTVTGQGSECHLTL